MRVVLVVNPAASSVAPRSRVTIRRTLARSHDVEVVETEERGHATELARQAADEGAEVVAVLAGDGTLNEAANGLVGTDTALAALPGGSTNVFARTLGMVDDLDEAAGQLRSALDRGSRRRIGLGVVEDRRFLFHVGMGYDAAVVAQVEQRGRLKRYASHALFVAAAFSTWFRHYDHSRPRLAVHLPDGTSVDDAYFCICLNSDPYTYLGPKPLHLAPDADLERPLAMVSLRTLAVGPLLRAVGSALRGRGVRQFDYVDYRADLETVEVRGHGPFPYQVDGDYLGEVEGLRFRHEPDALDLVVP